MKNIIFNEKEKYIEFNNIQIGINKYRHAETIYDFVDVFSEDYWTSFSKRNKFRDAYKEYKKNAFTFFYDIEDEYKKLYKYLGLSSLRLFTQAFKNYDRFTKIITQAEKDGNENIIPFIIFYGWTPKTLKNKIGKSTWKKLCNNNLQKNRAMVRFLIKKNFHRSKLKKIKSKK